MMKNGDSSQTITAWNKAWLKFLESGLAFDHLSSYIDCTLSWHNNTEFTLLLSFFMSATIGSLCHGPFFPLLLFQLFSLLLQKFLSFFYHLVVSTCLVCSLWQIRWRDRFQRWHFRICLFVTIPFDFVIQYTRRCCGYNVLRSIVNLDNVGFLVLHQQYNHVGIRHYTTLFNRMTHLIEGWGRFVNNEI